LSKKKHKKAHLPKHHYDEGPFRKYLVNVLLFLSFSLILTSFAILLMVIFEEKPPKKEIAAPVTKTPSEQLIEKMGKIVRAEEEKAEIPLESDDYANALKLVEPEPKKPKPEPVVEAPKVKKPPVKAALHKPKLAIIIDDVSNLKEIKSLKKTGIPLTLSIFPPTGAFPSTPKIARGLDFYMIHLPLEAMNFASPQEDTLTISSSPLEIEGRIKEIRRLFPSAKMINNHTGSKFTADKGAMERLIPTLKRYGFTFVDSRTTASSKAVETGKKSGMHVLSRDIFLDNKADVAYIHEQLKKAVEVAKKKGSAIAIGHPREKTIEALNHAGGILKDVDVVYLKELI